MNAREERNGHSESNWRGEISAKRQTTTTTRKQMPVVSNGYWFGCFGWFGEWTQQHKNRCQFTSITLNFAEELTLKAYMQNSLEINAMATIYACAWVSISVCMCSMAKWKVERAEKQ